MITGVTVDTVSGQERREPEVLLTQQQDRADEGISEHKDDEQIQQMGKTNRPVEVCVFVQ